MTINDIENILYTLKTNHPDLNDDLLVTILKAGGWEEKNIRDAVTIFHSSVGKKLSIPSSVKFAPIQTENILPEIIDTTHELSDHYENNIEKKDNNETDIEKIDFKKEDKDKSEKELIKTPSTNENKSEIPENLPIKPFDNNQQPLSFSAYKNFFPQKEEMETEKISEALKEEIEENKEKNITNKEEDNKLKTKASFGKKEEKLVIVLGVLLFIILMLLYYM